MTRLRFPKSIAIVALAATLAACDNPATGKTAATVGEAKPETPPAAGAEPVAGSEKLVIAPENSKVEWIGSKVTGKHDGGFKAFSGTVTLVDGKPEKSRVEIDIDATSIWSDTDRLTTHLRSADFFEVEKFPKARFVSTAVKAGGKDGASHTIVGNLELHGVKKSIEFPATVSVTAGQVEVRSEFYINRKDFDINYAGKANDLIRDEVVIKLDLKLPRKQA